MDFLRNLFGKKAAAKKAVGKTSAKKTSGKKNKVKLDIQGLISALKDSDTNVGNSAAKALGELGDPRGVEPLIAVLKDTASYAMHNKAATALGKIGDARAVEPLINELSMGNIDAAIALGEIGDARAVQPLIDFMHRYAIEHVCNGAIALSKIGDARAVEPINDALERYEEMYDVLLDHQQKLFRSTMEAVRSFQEGRHQQSELPNPLDKLNQTVAMAKKLSKTASIVEDDLKTKDLTGVIQNLEAAVRAMETGKDDAGRPITPDLIGIGLLRMLNAMRDKAIWFRLDVNSSKDVREQLNSLEDQIREVALALKQKPH